MLRFQDTRSVFVNVGSVNIFLGSAKFLKVRVGKESLG
jgi:hypothetical protein